MPTIGNAPSGEKTTPVTTDKIPISGSQYVQLANLLKIISGLTEDTSPNNTADFILTYDDSDSSPKKVKPSTLASLAQTFANKRNTKRSVTVTAGATPTINTDNGDIFVITGLATNITSLTTNLSGTPNDGDMMLMRITDNGTARTITPGASFAGTSSFAITALTTTISKELKLLWMWSSAISKWELVGNLSSL